MIGIADATPIDMPETEEKPSQVYAAAVTNFVIAGSKLIAAALTGSSTMSAGASHLHRGRGPEIILAKS